MFRNRKKTVATLVTFITFIAIAMVAYTVETGDWQDSSMGQTAAVK